MPGLFDVSKEIILVTGASQGLGRQFARVLSAHGAAVALAARQTAELKRLEDEILGQGGGAVAVQMDVTDTASIAKAIDRAEAALGPVSVLINNAGIAVEKLAVDQTEADWDSVINANLKGAYFAATEMARRMIARKQQGNIVNIASVLGLSVMKFLSPYTISKAGIIQATRAMALELAGRRIRVNSLAPGYIDTGMNHEFWSSSAGEKLTQRLPQRPGGGQDRLVLGPRQFEEDKSGAGAVLCLWSIYLSVQAQTAACALPRRPVDDAIDQAIVAIDEFVLANSSLHPTRPMLEDFKRR